MSPDSFDFDVANNSYSMSKIMGWQSDNWNSETATVLLTNLQKNKGQTNETREHAALILSWMSLRQSIGTTSILSMTGSVLTSSAEDSTSTRGGHDRDIPSSTLSPRNSIQIDFDPGRSGIGNNGQYFCLLVWFVSLFLI
jgi:hypothetical protein